MAFPALAITNLRQFTPQVPTRYFDLHFDTAGQRLFIAGGFDGSLAGKQIKRRDLLCWDSTAERELWLMEDLKRRPIHHLAVHDRCGSVASTSALGEATLRDGLTGELIGELAAPGLSNISVAGERGFIGCSSWQGRHTVSLWDARSGIQIAECLIGNGTNRTPAAVIGSAYGDLACALVSNIDSHGKQTGDAVVVNVADLTPVAQIPLPFRPVQATLLDRSDRLAVFGRREDGTFLAIVDLHSHVVVASLSLKKKEPRAIAYSAKLDCLGLLRANGTLEFYDTVQLQLLRSLPATSHRVAGVTNLKFDQHGRIALAAFGDLAGSGSYAIGSFSIGEKP